MTNNIVPLGGKPDAQETVPDMLRAIANEIETNGYPARAVVLVESYPDADTLTTDPHLCGVDLVTEAVGMIEIGKAQLIAMQVNYE